VSVKWREVEWRRLSTKSINVSRRCIAFASPSIAPHVEWNHTWIRHVCYCLRGSFHHAWHSVLPVDVTAPQHLMLPVLSTVTAYSVRRNHSQAVSAFFCVEQRRWTGSDRRLYFAIRKAVNNGQGIADLASIQKFNRPMWPSLAFDLSPLNMYISYTREVYVSTNLKFSWFCCGSVLVCPNGTNGRGDCLIPQYGLIESCIKFSSSSLKNFSDKKKLTRPV